MGKDKAYGFVLGACRPLPEYLKTEIALALRTEAYAPDEVSDMRTYSVLHLVVSARQLRKLCKNYLFAKESA